MYIRIYALTIATFVGNRWYAEYNGVIFIFLLFPTEDSK